MRQRNERCTLVLFRVGARVETHNEDMPSRGETTPVARKNARTERRQSVLTDEVDDEAAVAGAAGGAAEERPPVRRRAVGAVARGRQADVVARVRQRVAEAEDARVAAERRRRAAAPEDGGQEREGPPRRQRRRRGGATVPRKPHGRASEAPMQACGRRVSDEGAAEAEWDCGRELMDTIIQEKRGSSRS